MCLECLNTSIIAYKALQYTGEDKKKTCEPQGSELALQNISVSEGAGETHPGFNGDLHQEWEATFDADRLWLQKRKNYFNGALRISLH